MITRIEHIGIFVHDLEASLARLSSLLHLEVTDPRPGHTYLRVGQTDLELLHPQVGAPAQEDPSVPRQVGVHHIAFEVDDLDEAYEELRSTGIRMMMDGIGVGARGKRQLFAEAGEILDVAISLVEKPRETAST